MLSSSRRLALRLSRPANSSVRMASSGSSGSSLPQNTATPGAAYEPTTPASATGAAPPAPQAPNYPTTWSTNQRVRPVAGQGPRFEQTLMEFQPAPLSAMEMVSQDPIRLVKGRKAVCDGGGGPLGHPKIYINLDQPGPRSCGYCGIRYEKDPHHH